MEQNPCSREAEAPAPSVPLHGLIDYAPDISGPVDYSRLPFVFSNDESAASYDEARSRLEDPDYTRATNRTAVIVGEGSLMAALPMIPEETIVVVDKSPEMCAYMARYVEVLREAGGIDEWAENMGFYKGDVHAIRKLRLQAAEWYDTGYTHPAHYDEAFVEASQLAQEKTIIPWRADLASRADMEKLGRTLEEHDANVTLLNITNTTASHFRAVRRAKHAARRLGRLPVLQSTPILATTYQHKPPIAPYGYNFVRSAGPFKGLDYLVRHGLNRL
jgi:hypothetical protein